MADKTEIEVWIAINEDGDYEVGTDAVEAGERLLGKEGLMQRLVKIKVKIAPPVVTEAEVEISDEDGEIVKVEG